MKILTKQDAEQKRCAVFRYGNGDYSYIVDKTEHLIRNGIEIAKGDWVFSYINGDYTYKVNGIDHLMRNGKEIAKGDYVRSYPNMNYECTVRGINHLFNKDHKEITI